MVVRYRHLLVLIFISSFLSISCSSKIGYFFSSAIDPATSHEIKIDDSAFLTYYAFKIGVDESDITIFFIPGSGCTSLRYYFKRYFSGIKGNIRFFALQKRNVDNNNMGILDCGKEFHETNYFQQWVSDQRRFIEAVSLNHNLRQKPIVLLGVSEGSNVAAAVAASSPVVTHLAILGGGGMKQIDELKLLVSKSGYKGDIDKAFVEISNDPNNIARTVFGQTYKYWNSIAHVDPLKYYNVLKIPIFAGIGELDKSVPVESAYHLRNHFQKDKKDNLTICFYRNADHGLVDTNGRSFRPHYFSLLANWINSTVGDLNIGSSNTNSIRDNQVQAKPYQIIGDEHVYCN